VPEGLPLKEGFPPGALRWLDACSLWWLSASKQALGGGQINPETAQVVGLGWGSTPPVQSLIEQVRGNGFSAMAPALFPYSVGNAPAAQAGILLKLRGAAVTLCAKEASGLAAVTEASAHMEAGLFKACVAGGVDHLDPYLRGVLRPFRRGAGVPAGEGAYALMLERREDAPEIALARIAAWTGRSVACVPRRFPDGTGLLDQTLEDLLRQTGWAANDVDFCVLPQDTPALRQASALAAARSVPRAKPLAFQPALGACGASWAGAAALAAREVASGRSRRAVLVALATGGCSWGLALEKPNAQ
jgi:3-oxoacyl-(acyl-carrier-protein) synthase